MKTKQTPVAVTECNRSPWSLSSVRRRKLVGNFLGGRLTSDAGALLLREVDKELGLTQKLADCISDTRHPSYVRHRLVHMLRQRIGAIALGYEDLNDHTTLVVPEKV